MKAKFSIVSLTILVNLFLVTGCEVKDLFIEELEVAEQQIKPEDELVATSRVAQKYFPIGMKRTDFLKALYEFYKNGYQVLEIKHEGTRLWPNKEFRNYPDINRQKKYSVGTKGYVLKKQYVTGNVFITQTAVISIKLNSSNIVIESKSHIDISGI